MVKIKKGDTVRVMRGKDAGKDGEVLRVVTKKKLNGAVSYKVVVKGVNIVKKSQKPNPQAGIQGGIIEFEKSVDMSNVMFLDKKLNVPSRIGFRVDEKTGKKVRFSKKSGEII
jgi:large subunit ribosomal protein L24